MPTRIVSLFASLLAALALVLTLALGSMVATAAPPPSSSLALAQNVDWMTGDQASSLDRPFAVMVPTFIPAPFSGSPSISGGGDSYSLYWVNYGGPPTFLLIEGAVGGSLPAGSPADLNNQLFVNASVGGVDAIHDVTSIYDTVWWISGDVLYSVSSRNMTGTDSLSLANALVALQPPVAPEPEPTTPAVPTSVPTQAPQPTDVPEPAAPPAAQPTNAATTPAEGESGPVEEATVAAPEASLVPTEADGTPAADGALGVGGSTATDDDGPADTEVAIAEVVAADLLTDTLASISILGSVALQDGTGGADLPQAGDGTGGILEIAIP